MSFLRFRIQTLQVSLSLFFCLVTSLFQTANGQSSEHLKVFDVNTQVLDFGHPLSPRNLVKYKDKILFTASNPISGREIWSYDISSGKSAMLLEVVSGVDSAYAEDLVVVDDTLYFFANHRTDPNQYMVNKELWKYDLISGEATPLTALELKFDYENYILESPHTPVYFNNQLFFTIQGRYVSWLYSLDLATDELTVIKDSAGDEYVVSEIVTVYENKLHFVADGKLLTLDGNNQIQQITSEPIETEIHELGRLFSPGKGMPRVDDKLFIHSYNTPLEFLVLEKGEQQTRHLDHYYPGLDESNFDYFLPLWADDSGLWFAATNADNQSGIWQLNKATGEYQFLEAVENVERLIFLKSSDSGFYYHGAAYLHGLMEFSVSSGQSRRVGRRLMISMPSRRFSKSAAAGSMGFAGVIRWIGSRARREMRQRRWIRSLAPATGFNRTFS